MPPEDGHEHTGSAAQIPGFKSHATSTAGGLITSLKFLYTTLWLIMHNLFSFFFFLCNRLNSGHCQLEKLNGSTSINAGDGLEKG